MNDNINAYSDIQIAKAIMKLNREKYPDKYSELKSEIIRRHYVDFGKNTPISMSDEKIISEFLNRNRKNRRYNIPFKKLLYIFVSTIIFMGLFKSCKNSEWEIIKGAGIDDSPKSINGIIYFENEKNGLVGGYVLVPPKEPKNEWHLDFSPILYMTEDGGANWKMIDLKTERRSEVTGAYLHGDTIICQLDSIVLRSFDRGINFETENISSKRYSTIQRSSGKKFVFKGDNYRIKEEYRNGLAVVIVCYGKKTLTDYYFVSFDDGINWKLLQETYGDNRARFLLEDKYLYCYEFQTGLLRLKLR